MYYKNYVTPVSGLMNYLLFFFRWTQIDKIYTSRKQLWKKGGYSHGRRILWWTIYLSQTLELVETKIILQCMYMYEVVPTVKNTEWNVQTETISVFVFVYIMCSLNAATFGRILLELWSHNSSEQTNDDITNKLEDKDFILFDFRILTFVVVM